MTRPTAPCLTADFYTYSTYSPARDDYYGGFEPKNERNEHRTPIPMRREPEKSSKNNQRGKEDSSSSAHCISFIYCALAVIVILFNAFMYHNGIKNTFVIYLSAAMGVIALTSVLMNIGIAVQQPFLCIPFVVLRTMEIFVSVILLSLFTYAMANTESNQFNFFLQCTKMAGQLVSPHFKFDYVDATFQLCIIGWCISLVFLSVSVYVCRVSFLCTMAVADQIRYKRYHQHVETSQPRFVGDEFYCS